MCCYRRISGAGALLCEGGRPSPAVGSNWEWCYGVRPQPSAFPGPSAHIQRASFLAYVCAFNEAAGRSAFEDHCCQLPSPAIPGSCPPEFSKLWICGGVERAFSSAYRTKNGPTMLTARTEPHVNPDTTEPLVNLSTLHNTPPPLLQKGALQSRMALSKARQGRQGWRRRHLCGFPV